MSDSRSLSIPTVRIPPPPSAHSPLRSPKRRQRLPVDEDPLLGKLSPDTILDALAAINAVATNEGYAKDLLTRSISQASAEDRLLGTRAAITAKKLREWLKELQAWQWPKGHDIQHGKGFMSPSKDTMNDTTEFWGSLPAQLVVEHEARLEQIRDGIDSLNVDELKEHIMNVHVPGRSRPSSAHSALSAISAPPFTHIQLSDFTAVITATILRALPTLARLNMLLETWTVRLLVLRQIPDLLSSLDAARTSLDSALLITQESRLNKRYSMIDFTSKREELAELIGTAASRMDTVLDALEGREDSIPETWIDKMDALETNFTTWIQLAEKMTIERAWAFSELKVAQQATIEDEGLQRNVPAMDQPGEDATEEEVHDHVDDSSSPAVNEATRSDGNNNNTAPQNTTPSSREGPTPSTDVVDVNLVVTSVTISLPTVDTMEVPNLPTDEEESIPEITTIETRPSSAEVLPRNADSNNAPAAANHEQTGADPGPHVSELELVHSDGQGSSEVETAIDYEPETSTLPLRLKKSIPILAVIEESLSEDSESQHSSEPGQTHAQPLVQLRPSPISDRRDSDSATEMQTEINPATTENNLESQPVPASPFTISQVDQHSTDLGNDMSSEQSQEHQLQHLEIPAANQTSGDHLSQRDTPSTLRPVTGVIQHPKAGDSDDLDQIRAATAGKSNSDISVPASDADQSSPRRLDFESPQSIMTPSLALEDPAIKGTPQSSLIESSPVKVMGTDSQNFGALLEQNIPIHPDIPVQSIETPSKQDTISHSFQGDNEITSIHSRKISAGGQSYRSTVPFSPAVFSSTSDRTVRERESPQLSSSALQDLETFKHSNDASLPLQRFINDKSDVSYSINHEMTPNSPSSRGNTSRYLREDTESPRFSNRSVSPPANVVPRRAIRGPSSSLMRGTISSLNKVVGTTKRSESDSYNHESERLLSRSRLGSPYDADSPILWRRKSSTSDLLQAPRPHLQNQPSMESIGSYVSSNGTSDMRRRYSFSTDGGSFAIRPVHEADSDLQEKIHSILTSIPGKIRLSNNPARDFDQQSVMSSMSSSKRARLKAQSPFSTPSRAGTPTPSEGFTPSSRQRRTTSHKSEDKTVKVYHLHHRGKTEPTKLFVRTVGEDGERVMVRVGGGWADLGEYLREYVLHHGRQTPSSSNVEVKGLLATSTSPRSTTSAAATVIAQSSPGAPATAINRPGSSLSIHKIRRTSKPSELPELAIDDTENSPENLPLPSFLSTARRSSISSINSVSVSSILGDGSSVYSPHPGSARAPLSHSSTPLGLAGPKPRTRHVSMTPESEAWVEDVIGQARRTSSTNIKPTGQKHTDHRSERELHDSSRMSIRSVSDIPSGGRNKRVVLKGLGSHDRS
ncbi:GAS2 domain protein [Talaromyces stipitatus ATCC 10500]|uniref:GAS2 domain protein n=1 Tax=Talaromyces stipitatus (strain ATCC 10500 / CBS 375.48 / QM 6759 / NRRL 1006) TaxID=441959 RepID=B8M697_TALSN|nr:GAS2 domain protein [Talaromyces stipitatus ATCC 10500]EED19272.1 GAS2 domain protein [Talaromyces stipitatus ATCC 10500]